MRTEGGVVREPLCPPEFEMTGRWVSMQVYWGDYSAGSGTDESVAGAGESRFLAFDRNDKIIFGYSFLLPDNVVFICGLGGGFLK